MVQLQINEFAKIAACLFHHYKIYCCQIFLYIFGILRFCALIVCLLILSQEDVQLILQQQVQSQQLAEETQKKPSRMGILRRTNRPPMQRPSPSSTPTPPTTNSSQIFVSRSAVSAPQTPPSMPSPSPPAVNQRTWRDRLKRGRNSRQAIQDAEWGKTDSGFQVISLD